MLTVITIGIDENYSWICVRVVVNTATVAGEKLQKLNRDYCLGEGSNIPTWLPSESSKEI